MKILRLLLLSSLIIACHSAHAAERVKDLLVLGNLSLTNPLPTAQGGLGVVLADPNADRMLFWDDSAGAYAYLSLSGATISGTTLAVDAIDATLAALGAVTINTAGQIYYATGIDTFSTVVSTVAGRSILSAADAAAMKTILSLGNVENTALSTWAGTANITTLGTVGTGTWNATTITTGKGGTGIAAGYTKGDILVATDATTLVKLPAGTDGHFLTADAAEPSGLKYSAGGTGTVTTSGPPTSGQFAKWSSATNIVGVSLGTGVETFLTTPTFANLSSAVTGATIFGNTTASPALEAAFFAADAGANDTYVATLSPTPTLVTGARYRFKANTANTGAATINFNSLGAITIKKAVSGITTDLADNDIRAGQWVDLVYDGTNMQMQSTLGNASGGGSGTVNSGTASQLAYYATTGTAVSATGTSLTWNGSNVFEIAATNPAFSFNATGGAAGTQLIHKISGTAKGYMGVSAATNGIITGSASGDSCIRAESGQAILFSTDSGSGNIKINSSRQISDSSGTLAFTSAASLTGGSIATTWNATSGDTQLIHKISGTTHAYWGVAGATNGLATGSAAGDTVIRTEAKTFNISTDSGSSIALKVNSSGQVSAEKTTASTSTSTGAMISKGGLGVAGRTSTATLNVGTGTTIASIFSGTGSLNFGSISAGAEETLTITITGIATTNTPSVALGWSAALENGIVVKQAWVSAADTVSVRVANVSAAPIDPAAVTCRATVTGF